MNKTCDVTNVVLSDNVFDYVHKTKYLGVLLFSDIGYAPAGLSVHPPRMIEGRYIFFCMGV